MSAVPVRRRPEKHLERQVLRAVGRTPGLLIGINTVGVWIRPSALGALAAALRPYGEEIVRVAIDTLTHHRASVGLGVGSPDLVGCVDGRAFGLELKTPTGTLEAHQAAWHHAALKRAAFQTFVVRAPEEAVEAIAAVRRGGGVE